MTKLNFVSGNAVSGLLNGEVDVLINQVNCQGKYGSGIAAEITARIPGAKDAYRCHVERHTPRELLGTSIFHMGIVHIFGQLYYGREKRHTHYGHLAMGLISVKDTVYNMVTYGTDPKQVIIGVPDLIGCGNAGGDREVVLELLEATLGWAKEIRIYSYT